eukprot:COSAG01_NODE_17043_length_1183_cov_0.595018_1_plen_188_part_10
MAPSRINSSVGCGLCAVWHLRHGKLAAQSLAAATAAGEGQEQAAGGGGGGGGPSVADCADFADAVLELVHAAAPLGSADDDEASLLWAQARTHFGWHCGHRLWATSDGAGDTASSTLLAQAMLRRLCADVRAAPEPHRRLIGVEYVLDLARLCYWQQSPETSPCPSSSSSSSSSSPPQQATGPCTGPE